MDYLAECDLCTIIGENTHFVLLYLNDKPNFVIRIWPVNISKFKYVHPGHFATILMHYLNRYSLLLRKGHFRPFLEQIYLLCSITIKILINSLQRSKLLTGMISFCNSHNTLQLYNKIAHINPKRKIKNKCCDRFEDILYQIYNLLFKLIHWEEIEFEKILIHLFTLGITILYHSYCWVWILFYNTLDTKIQDISIITRLSLWYTSKDITYGKWYYICYL